MNSVTHRTARRDFRARLNHSDTRSGSKERPGNSSQEKQRRETSLQGLIVPRSAVFLEFIVQGLQAHAQNLRGPRLVLPSCLKRAHNQQPLCLVHGGSHTHGDRTVVVGRRSMCLILAEPGRQVPCLERRAIRAKNHRPLDRVAQLARVARPIMSASAAPASTAIRLKPCARVLVHLVHHGLNHGRQIVQVFAQRRHVNVEDIQPVEEVGAQMALGDSASRIAIGGRQHAHVHILFTARAQPPELALLQHAQQLGLRAMTASRRLHPAAACPPRPARSSRRAARPRP